MEASASTSIYALPWCTSRAVLKRGEILLWSPGMAGEETDKARGHDVVTFRCSTLRLGRRIKREKVRKVA